MPNNKIAAIVVCYFPQHAQLMCLLDRLLPQVDQVVIIDNSAANQPIPAFSEPRIRILPQSTNIGVAKALNLGIEAAANAGMEFVLLFDQDSTPPPGMVKTLLDDLRSIESSNHDIAAIGPEILSVNETRNQPRQLFHASTPPPSAGDSTHQVNYLITSGKLIRLSTLQKIGCFEEGLFIDFVDIEWCYRAASMGWHCYRSTAQMPHSFGETALSLLNRKLLSLRSPIRYYYIYRNLVLLRNRSYFPRSWVLDEFIKSFMRLLLIGFPDGQGLKRQYYAIRGLMDGIKGKTGALNSPH